MLSYQSLVPAHQDYENLGRCAVEVFAVTGAVHTPPLDSRFRENDELGGQGITILVGIARAGWCRHTKV